MESETISSDFWILVGHFTTQVRARLFHCHCSILPCRDWRFCRTKIQCVASQVQSQYSIRYVIIIFRNSFEAHRALRWHWNHINSLFWLSCQLMHHYPTNTTVITIGIKTISSTQTRVHTQCYDCIELSLDQVASGSLVRNTVRISLSLLFSQLRAKGMTLNQLGQLMEAHGLAAEVHHSELSSAEEFRNLSVANLNEPRNFIISTSSLSINF